MSATKILLLSLLLSFGATAIAQDHEDYDDLPTTSEIANVITDEWKLVSEADDIRVYRRPSAASTIDEVRIEATFRTTMPIFLDLISDVGRYPEWVYKCSEARMISEESDKEVIYYARTAFPWPLQDRDLVIYSSRSIDLATGIAVTTSTAQSKVMPTQAGVVRINQFDSVWKITPVSDSTIRVDYKVTTDPGGVLPDWVVNLGITSGPRKTMEQLAGMVKTANRLAEVR